MSHEKNIQQFYQYVTEGVCTCVDTLGVCLGAAAYLISGFVSHCQFSS